MKTQQLIRPRFFQEFIAMMKDRVNRGLKTFSRQEGWTGFKKCVKQEVRAVH
jgi:hypothetical protein